MILYLTEGFLFGLKPSQIEPATSQLAWLNLSRSDTKVSAYSLMITSRPKHPFGTWDNLLSTLYHQNKEKVYWCSGANGFSKLWI